MTRGWRNICPSANEVTLEDMRYISQEISNFYKNRWSEMKMRHFEIYVAHLLSRMHIIAH